MMNLLRTVVLLSLVSAGCSSPGEMQQPQEDGFPQVKHMIDTHIHLFDPLRPEGIPWPRQDDEVLYRPHLPAEFKQVSKSSGLTGVVVVEASDRLEDNRWVLDLVADDEFFVALVGNIDPYRDDFETHLKALKEDKRFVGVRARNAQPIDFSDARVLANLRLLAEHGLSLDFLANGQGIPGVQAVDGLARAVPELRIVVDHVLGYDIDGQAPASEWVQAVESLAANPNVYCKVSGLYQRCVQQPAPADDAYYRGLLDVLWKNFGHKRLIYGSNWPCTKMTGDYASFVRLVTRYFAEKGEAASEHYFWKNASTAYRLGLN